MGPSSRELNSLNNGVTKGHSKLSMKATAASMLITR